MTFEHKEGQGSLFKNDYKKSDSHPDYKGTIKLSGKDYDIAAWVKDGKKGKFFSLKVSEPWKKGYPDIDQAVERHQPHPDEDIPWD